MIRIGSDHGGYSLKQALIQGLEEKGCRIKDYGCYSAQSCDYPVYAKAVSQGILSGEIEEGILVCGTGIGIAIAANKIPGIRAAVCTDTFSARAAKEHNHANILAMGERVIGKGLALEIAEAFLKASFSSDKRHVRRISMMENEEITYKKGE